MSSCLDMGKMDRTGYLGPCGLRCTLAWAWPPSWSSSKEVRNNACKIYFLENSKKNKTILRKIRKNMEKQSQERAKSKEHSKKKKKEKFLCICKRTQNYYCCCFHPAVPLGFPF